MEKFEAIGLNTSIGPQVLHKYNTAIYTHDFPYQGIDHIFRELDENSGAFFFREMISDFDMLVGELGSIGIQRLHNDEPSQTDLDTFNRVIGNTLGKFSIDDFFNN